MCYVDRVRSAAGSPACPCMHPRWQLVEILVCSRSCSPCFSRPPFLGTTPRIPTSSETVATTKVPPQSSHNGQNSWATTAGAPQAPTTRQHVGLGGILGHRKEWVRRSEASCRHTGRTCTSRPGQTVELVHHIPHFHCPGAPNTRYVHNIKLLFVSLASHH
jgi:hypothetical protein